MRIPFDSLCLRAVCQEASAALTGGVVQRIVQPSPLELAVTVYRAGAPHTLLASCDAVWARMCLVRSRLRALPQAPPFTMVCRKHLYGARVTRIAQEGFDRIVHIFLEGASGSFRLTGEFMGRHSNIILTDASGVILDAAKRVPASANRYRQLLPGILYVPPPAPCGLLDPFAPSLPAALQELLPAGAGVDDLAGRLRAKVQGLSPFLARELALRMTETDAASAWRGIFGAAAAGEWEPVLIRSDAGEPVGAYPLKTRQLPAHWQHPRDTFCEALEAYSSSALRQSEADEVRRTLEGKLRIAADRLERRLAEVRSAISQEAAADELERAANLILAHPHAARDPSGCVTVPNLYEEGAPLVQIAVDAERTPAENAQTLFRQSRKMRSAAAVARRQLPHLEEERLRIAQLQQELASASTMQDLGRVEAGLRSAGITDRPPGPSGGTKREAPPEFRHIRTLITPEGWTILLGENAEANDTLLRRIAAPDDLWLHARAVASSHAIIRTGGRPESVPQEVIRRAAELVARKSAARHSSIVPVDYTLRKFVRKPRGSPPGAVIYEREKTIHVSPGDHAATDA